MATALKQQQQQTASVCIVFICFHSKVTEGLCIYWWCMVIEWAKDLIQICPGVCLCACVLSSSLLSLPYFHTSLSMTIARDLTLAKNGKKPLSVPWVKANSLCKPPFQYWLLVTGLVEWRWLVRVALDPNWIQAASITCFSLFRCASQYNSA